MQIALCGGSALFAAILCPGFLGSVLQDTHSSSGLHVSVMKEVSASLVCIFRALAVLQAAQYEQPLLPHFKHWAPSYYRTRDKQLRPTMKGKAVA